MEHEVLIEDFDFVVHYLQVNIGDKIIFRLSNRVPLHAEHIIYGVSETKQLCFESEVLHIKEQSSFEFVPEVAGDIGVTCKIFMDMFCSINVRDPNQSDESYESDEDDDDEDSEEDEDEQYYEETKGSEEEKRSKVVPILEGIAQKLIPGTSPQRSAECETVESDPLANERDSDSFYDSDDVFSLDEATDDQLFCETLRDGKSPILLNQSEIANIFDKPKDLVIPDVKQLPSSSSAATKKNLPSQNPLSLSSTSPVMSGKIESKQENEVNYFTIYINEFSFHPKSAQCSTEEKVRFYLNENEITHCSLSCEGQFERIIINSQQPFFIHQFSQKGEYVIFNEIYNFVECKLTVLDPISSATKNRHPPTPPKLFGSFSAPVNTIPPKPVFNLASNQKKSPSAASPPSSSSLKVSPALARQEQLLEEQLHHQQQHLHNHQYSSPIGIHSHLVGQQPQNIAEYYQFYQQQQEVNIRQALFQDDYEVLTVNPQQQHAQQQQPPQYSQSAAPMSLEGYINNHPTSLSLEDLDINDEDFATILDELKTIDRDVDTSPPPTPPPPIVTRERLDSEGTKEGDEDGDDESTVAQTKDESSDSANKQFLSRKAKKNKRRKEKLKQQKKAQKENASKSSEPSPQSSASSSVVNQPPSSSVEQFFASDLEKVSQQQELPSLAVNRGSSEEISSPKSPEKSPVKENYLLATIDYSAEFEELTDEEMNDPIQSKPVSQPELEQKTLNQTTCGNSPRRKKNNKNAKNESLAIDPSTPERENSYHNDVVDNVAPASNFVRKDDLIIISPAEKMKTVDESIYDENISFDSEDNEEEGQEVSEARDQPDQRGLLFQDIQEQRLEQFLQAEGKEVVEEKESHQRSSQLITSTNVEEAPATPPRKESLDLGDPSKTLSSGKKTNTLLSALGLKGKPDTPNDKSSELAASSLSNPPGLIPNPVTSLPISLPSSGESSNEGIAIEANSSSTFVEMKPEIVDFFFERYLTIKEKYSLGEKDQLPRGRQVPIVHWEDLPSNIPAATAVQSVQPAPELPPLEEKKDKSLQKNDKPQKASVVKEEKEKKYPPQYRVRPLRQTQDYSRAKETDSKPQGVRDEMPPQLHHTHPPRPITNNTNNASNGPAINQMNLKQSVPEPQYNRPAPPVPRQSDTRAPAPLPAPAPAPVPVPPQPQPQTRPQVPQNPVPPPPAAVQPAGSVESRSKDSSEGQKGTPSVTGKPRVGGDEAYLYKPPRRKALAYEPAEENSLPSTAKPSHSFHFHGPRSQPPAQQQRQSQNEQHPPHYPRPPRPPQQQPQSQQYLGTSPSLSPPHGPHTPEGESRKYRKPSPSLKH